MSIELNHISCSYPGGAQESVTVFDDFSLHIADGEFIGIMGHTGCAKTTLLQLMAGLIAPSGGEVLINGGILIKPDMTGASCGEAWA